MSAANDLEDWIVTAIRENGGEASIVEIARHIWTHHEAKLRAADGLFFTWQYQMRWAGQRLQKAGRLKKLKSGNHARWVLI